jgi:2-haloacid dehalogenase
MLDFSRFKAITFDCYGTLIDWETGLLSALGPILTSHGQHLPNAAILELYGELEPKAQTGNYRTYREVLADVVRGFGQRLGFTPSDSEASSLAESLKNWKPFPDTVAGLKRLKTRYKLAIVSNVDDDLFAGTAPQLEVAFEEVITAQQARAYKPSLEMFRLALQRLGLEAAQVLHAGQSVYHDVIPAKSLGMTTVWVTRRGFGATKNVDGKPDLQVSDIKTLTEHATKRIRTRLAGG